MNSPYRIYVRNSPRGREVPLMGMETDEAQARERARALSWHPLALALAEEINQMCPGVPGDEDGDHRPGGCCPMGGEVDRPARVDNVRRFAYAHLKSFRREQGPPYDQYVWIYSRAYGIVMRVVHRLGRHWWRDRAVGDRHCDWCGATQS